MNKRLIIAVSVIVIVILVITGLAIAVTRGNQSQPNTARNSDTSQSDDTKNNEEELRTVTDPDTGETYTVSGVSSGEAIDTNWIGGKFSLKKAGVSYDQVEIISNEIVKYVSEKFTEKYDAATIVSNSIVNPTRDVFEFKVRLDENTVIYVSATLQGKENVSVTITN